MDVTFSIVVPTHDRRELCVLAVRSALAQSRPPLEVIVLADGCTDGTASAVRALGDDRVRVLELKKEPGYGYAHRNRALEQARGDAVVFLGDDDLLLPDHLVRIGDLWDAGAFDVVQASAARVDADDRLAPMTHDWNVPGYRQEMLDGVDNRVPMAAISARVALLRSAGGWDPSLPRAADWNLWRRAIASGARSAVCLAPTVLYFHGTGRRQSPAERVAQNARYFDLMSSATGLARLRSDMATAVGRREFEREQERREVGRWAADMEAELERVLPWARGMEAELERVLPWARGMEDALKQLRDEPPAA